MTERVLIRHDGQMRAVLIATSLCAQVAFAATIRVGPDAGYQPIEAAQAGDEVLLAPGTYRFRLALTNSGTAASPIVIRAEDPSRPPVFDYSDADLISFPGSNAGFHPDRGAWDVRGSDLEFRSITIRGANTVGAVGAAAIRFSSGERHHVVDVRVEDCEGGLENVAGSLLVERSRFHRNVVHLNVFGGGPVTVRGNLMTDARDWNFYLAGNDALFEANWLSNSGGFAGLMGECSFTCGGTGAQPIARSIVFRGNVIVQNTMQQPNDSFFVGVLGTGGPSSDGTGFTQPNVVTFSHNTFVGRLATPTAALVLNSDGAHRTRVRAHGNAFTGFSSVVSELSATPATVESGFNWVVDGTDTAGVSASVTGPASALTSTYRPVLGSSLFGAAQTPAMLAPAFEFGGDGSGPPGVVPRTAATTAGAFETGSAMGPGDGGVTTEDAGVRDGDGGVSPEGRPARRLLQVGCGAGPGDVGTLAALLLLRRRRARNREHSPQA